MFAEYPIFKYPTNARKIGTKTKFYLEISKVSLNFV